MTLDSNLVIIIGWILTILGFVIVWRKSNHEIKSLDMGALRDASETIENYSEQLKAVRKELLDSTKIHEDQINIMNVRLRQFEAERNIYEEEVSELHTKIESLEENLKREEDKHRLEIFDLSIKLERLEERLKERDLIIEQKLGEIEDLKSWIERLCNQLKSIDQIPVKMRIRTQKNIE